WRAGSTGQNLPHWPARWPPAGANGLELCGEIASLGTQDRGLLFQDSTEGPRAFCPIQCFRSTSFSQALEIPQTPATILMCPSLPGWDGQRDALFARSRSFPARLQGKVSQRHWKSEACPNRSRTARLDCFRYRRTPWGGPGSAAKRRGSAEARHSSLYGLGGRIMAVARSDDG